jgi:transposase-like protein
MSQKLEFVERAAKGEAIASLCREYGVSRQTGHKWVKRFRERGYEGLEEESRRPKSVPLATAEELVMATLRARDEHARWGPIKLRVVLQRRFGEQAPSQRTIDDQTRLRSERREERSDDGFDQRKHPRHGRPRSTFLSAENRRHACATLSHHFTLVRPEKAPSMSISSGQSCYR